MANKRSSTKPHKFAADVLPNNSKMKSWGLLSQVFVMSQKKQWRNNDQTNEEIRHGEWNNKGVGFGAEISSAIDEEDCYSISKDGQEWKSRA